MVVNQSSIIPQSTISSIVTTSQTTSNEVDLNTTSEKLVEDEDITKKQSRLKISLDDTYHILLQVKRHGRCWTEIKRQLDILHRCINLSPSQINKHVQNVFNKKSKYHKPFSRKIFCPSQKRMTNEARMTEQKIFVEEQVNFKKFY